jgi:hypothetical protein
MIAPDWSLVFVANPHTQQYAIFNTEFCTKPEEEEAINMSERLSMLKFVVHIIVII